jgi:hypothetical protein
MCKYGAGARGAFFRFSYRILIAADSNGRLPSGIAGSNLAGGIDVCVVLLRETKGKMQDNQDKETITDEVKTEYKRIQMRKITPVAWMSCFL